MRTDPSDKENSETSMTDRMPRTLVKNPSVPFFTASPGVLMLFNRRWNRMKTTTQFRELIERDEILPAMGGYDALSANLIEQAGGEVVYMSGSSVSTTTHAYPDVGMTTLTEMVNRARQMVNAVNIPVFCDADTGYGNPINVVRTVE